MQVAVLHPGVAAKGITYESFGITVIEFFLVSNISIIIVVVLFIIIVVIIIIVVLIITTTDIILLSP